MEPSLLDIKPEQVCRVCLCDSNELKPLEAKLENENKTILEAINYVVNIDMKVEYDLPHKICNDCETILDLADSFKRRCLDSEDILGQQHLTIEQDDILDKLPVSFEKKTENSLENTSVWDVVNKLLKKESDLAIYADVTISKHKKSKTNNPKLDPVVIEIDDDEELKVEEETPLDDYENTEYLDDTVNYDEILDTDATNLETDTKQTKLTKPKFGKKCLKKTKKKAVPKKELDIFTCEKCGKLYNKKNSLRRHIARNHNKKLKVEVKTQLDDSENYNNILDTDLTNLESKTKQTKLKKKSKAVNGKKRLKKSRNKAVPKNELGTFTCEKCGKLFGRKDSLRIHIARKHDERYFGDFECDDCKKKFNHKYKLKAHLIRKHRPTVLKYDYPCKKCSRQFRYSWGLEKHLKLWHGSNYPCKECHLKFKDRESFEEHKKEHSDKDKLQLCTICGRWLSLLALPAHILRHKNIRPFQCGMCEKRFVSKGEVKVHMRSHTGDRNFLCPICGRGFATSSSMKSHRDKHSDARPYPCDVCSMAFKAPNTLRNHRRTHTGEKPYKCPLCDAVFPRSHHLTQHLRRHARDTPNMKDEIASLHKPRGRPSKLAEEGEIKEPGPEF